MNDNLATELISELHNINLNLMELTKVIKANNSNIDLESLFSNTVSSYCMCDDCANNNDGVCSKNQPMYNKCHLCMYYINDAVIDQYYQKE